MRQLLPQFIPLLLIAVMVLGMPPSSIAQATSQPTASIDQGEMPRAYVLSAAYPNPFNPQTSFSLTVRERQDVTVEVFNLLGLPVKRLFSGVLDAGESRTFLFDAGDLPSGIYLYRVTGERFTATRQVTLLK
jgi:hypothetical protein